VNEASFRGGSRIGWVNSSWPFATLTVKANRVAISSLGTYEFAPSEVVAIEPYGSVPLLASGIRIRHNRADYPETIIFWCMGSRDTVLKSLASTGFTPSGRAVQRAGGFPVRWSVVVAVIVLWNGLFVLDRSAGVSRSRPLGTFALVALLLIFGAATATRVWPRFQRLVLREGHHVSEINAFLILIQMITGFMFVVAGMMFLVLQRVA
jgi:hypothetical protein